MLAAVCNGVQVFGNGFNHHKILSLAIYLYWLFKTSRRGIGSVSVLLYIKTLPVSHTQQECMLSETFHPSCFMRF